MGSVRVGIVGVGNCATSLIQGVEYYKDADPTGTVPGLALPTRNTGRLETNGFDLTLNYDRDLGPARLGLNFAGNYTRSLKFRTVPGSVNRDCVGFFSPNCRITSSLREWIDMV